ncbi:MAG: SH3 domain-containing protein [Leptolyngbyaceae cyanobacterium SU_3_3]|nr:SH3 domain-containing protein [Leptolyngbyaceae cyanobacterium SU_3_3]
MMQSQSPQPTVTVSESPQAIASTSPSPKPKSTPLSPPKPQRAEPPADQSPESAPEPEKPAEAIREVESCKVTMAKISDPNPPLNVRSTPNTASNENVVGQLKNDTFVTIRGEQEGWFQISTPLKGWISVKNTDSGCNQKVERVSFGRGGNAATISDRFVGTGSHQYRFSLAKGQTLTVSSDRGDLPIIVAPDGKVMGDLKDSQQTWSGKLSATGDYTLEMESNFKGYKYSFLVEVK